MGGVGLTAVGFAGLYYRCLSALVDDGAVGTATAGGQAGLTVGAIGPTYLRSRQRRLVVMRPWTLLVATGCPGVELVALGSRRL